MVKKTINEEMERMLELANISIDETTKKKLFEAKEEPKEKEEDDLSPEEPPVEDSVLPDPEAAADEVPPDEGAEDHIEPDGDEEAGTANVNIEELVKDVIAVLADKSGVDITVNGETVGGEGEMPADDMDVGDDIGNMEEPSPEAGGEMEPSSLDVGEEDEGEYEEPELTGEKDETNKALMEALTRLAQKNKFKEAYAVDHIRRKLLKEKAREKRLNESRRVSQRSLRRRVAARRPVISEAIVNKIAQRVLARIVNAAKAKKAASVAAFRPTKK